MLSSTCSDLHPLETLHYGRDIPLQQIPMAKLTPLHAQPQTVRLSILLHSDKRSIPA